MTAAAAGDPGHDRNNARRLLGITGLLPFAASAAVLLLSADRGWQTTAADGLLNYAALVASFLGAVHWGAAAQGHREQPRLRLAWGVTPALVAWLLLGLPDSIALMGFAGLFALILVVDRSLLPVLDDDYRRLRLRLSVPVIILLLACSIAAPGAAT